MKTIFLTGVSVLALGIAPLIAQQGPASSDQPDAPYVDEQANDNGARERRLQRRTIQGGQDREEGPARNAMENPPAQSETAESDPWNRGVPFPPQDVSDNDLEPYGGDYPAAAPRPGPLAEVDDWPGDDSEDSAFFQEGEQVPEDIERFQEEDMWDGEDAWAADEARGPSPLAEQRRPSRDNQRLSSDENRRFDRRGQRPDRSETGAVGQRDRDQNARQDRRMDGESTTRNARSDRGLNMARVALRTARHALPEARFDSYEFEVEDGRRVIEIAGTDLEDGKRVEVDVYPNGRVHSISEAIDLDAVPESVRSAVRNELGRFRVAHSLRSLRRNLDLYYEFAGFASSGRPAIVEIRADGSDLSVRYLERG